MTRYSVYPTGSEAQAALIKTSPGVVSNGHLFLTGMTGSAADGSMPADPATQIRAAFDKIGAVLAAAGCDHNAIVEMTSYHVGIREHFELFNEIRAGFVSDPFPAWTAVGVAELRREGAIVEIRVIAALPS